jgi:DNA-binding response OmpR family regulator
MQKGKPNILLMEDDCNLGYILKEALEIKGFAVTHSKNGEEGLTHFRSANFHACILDVMMPQKDGFTVAKEIRKSDHFTPIIFLTARTMQNDKLKGFKLGADDYITKPFSSEELVLRLKAILKRTSSAFDEDGSMVFQLGAFTFYSHERKLQFKDKTFRLSTKESDLLKLLCENKNKIVRRETALKSIWGNDDYFTGRSMDVYIAKLRKLLREDDTVELQNIHGTGFKLIG